MTVTFYTFAERAEDQSTSTAGFSPTVARATMSLYLLDNPTVQDIWDGITLIIGGVNTAISTDGRLNRQPPMAHPQYPWLFASNIQTIQGIGTPLQGTGASQLEMPGLPNMVFYPQFRFDVEFTPRPYVVALDSSIPVLKNQVWYDDTSPADNGTGSPLNKKTSTFAAEYLRYTDFEYVPQANSITCSLGFMKFRATPGVTTPTEVNGVQFAGQPRLFLPDSILKIRWYQVPYRYITSANSYLNNRYCGYINQGSFMTWGPGSLQYLGFTAKRYTPPIQQLEQQFFGSSGYLLSSEKWCDIELTFLRTTRQINPAEAITVSNQNIVVGGHNLQPWLSDRGFHYVSTVGPGFDTTPSVWRPIWNSVDFRLFFCDPDTPNGYQIPLVAY